MELTIADLVLVCVYVVATLVVGMWPTRLARDSAFLISGRQLSGVSSGLTIAASKIGAGAIVTYAALIFAFGHQALWMYVGYILGYIVFYLFAARIHAESRSKEYLTIADYFRAHVGAGAAIAVGILTTASLFGWVLTNFIAGGKILSHVSGLSPSTATCVMALVIVSYLLAGGFNAVVRTDVIQYMSLLVVLIVLAVVVIGMPRPEQIASFEPMPLGQIVGLFVTGLFFPMGSAELWQRVYATKDARSLRRAILFASGSFIVLAGALSVIFVTLAYFGSPDPGVDQDIAIFDIVGSRLGVGFTGIWFIALVSAIASSADTFVFTTSASSILDIGERIVGVNAEKRVARIRVALVLCTALGVATAIFIGNIVDVTFLFAGMTMGLGAVTLVAWVYRSLPSWVVVFSCAVGTGASLAQAGIMGITVTTAVVNLGLSLLIATMGAVVHAAIRALYRRKCQ